MILPESFVSFSSVKNSRKAFYSLFHCVNLPYRLILMCFFCWRYFILFYLLRYFLTYETAGITGCVHCIHLQLLVDGVNVSSCRSIPGKFSCFNSHWDVSPGLRADTCVILSCVMFIVSQMTVMQHLHVLTFKQWFMEMLF